MQVIKVPGLNNLDRNNGCRNAGNAILAELAKKRDTSVLDVEEIHVENSDLAGQEKLIYENSKNAFGVKDKLIFLGGDHSISYVIGKAFLESFGEDSYLVVFDAHADAMPAMKEPTHEEWLRALIEKGFDASKIILVGVRKIELEERAFLDKNNVRYIELSKMEDLEVVCDGVMEFVNKPDAKIYVSFDIDVVDPAFAPSTGCLEPGGFSSREIIYFARRLAKLKGLKAVDIVEVDCEKDKERENVTVKLAVGILEEFL
jgi:arginase family enzyme